MSPWIQRILPPDPPIAPMAFSRRPVVHRFWAVGLLAALVGFTLGFILWSWQQGVLPATESYPILQSWHARVQILLFLGSFLLGFALQSGPHVIGGQPPPAQPLLHLLSGLWLGFVVSLLDGWGMAIGNTLISVAYLGAVIFLWRITQGGDPLRRLPRGIPLTVSFLPLALAPWLTLADPTVVLWVLWCGPVTSALVAGQQLIQNVLGGTLLRGGWARLFALALLVAWLLSTLATFTAWATWPVAAVAWLVVLGLFVAGTDLVPAAWRFGLAAISVTLVLGLLFALIAAFWLVWALPPDGAVHLLGAGMLTTLILGVVARVVRFFSGTVALNDRLLCYVLLVWGGVVLARVGTTLGWSFPEGGLLAVLGMGGMIVLGWSGRIALCLWRISRKITPELR
ncbi:MAG: NnrS family protein [Magnetococcales bacterium]|nr:NnrS family protein [Magnetococcales bacterium]